MNKGRNHPTSMAAGNLLSLSVAESPLPSLLWPLSFLLIGASFITQSGSAFLLLGFMVVLEGMETPGHTANIVIMNSQ